MENKEEKKLDNFFEEPSKDSAEFADRLPSLLKVVKTKYSSDGKLIHRLDIKFLNNGIEIKIPDKFNTNKGVDILKRIFDVEWNKEKYVLFVNKSQTNDSLYGQIKKMGIKNNKNLTNVNCILTITGKLGDKSMRYILEDAPTPKGENELNNIKELNGDEYNLLQDMKQMCKEKHRNITLIELNEKTNLNTDKLGKIIDVLIKRDSIFSKTENGVLVWGVK